MSDKKKKQAQVELFQIHNLVRRVETRADRQRAAGRHRMNLLLGGGLVRVVRGRFATVGKSTIVKLRRELIEKKSQGMLKVTDHVGREIDLESFAPLEELLAPARQPTPPLDNAANDKTFEHGVGEPKPQLAGGKAINEDVVTPAALAEEIPEGFEEVEESNLEEGLEEEADDGVVATVELEAQPPTELVQTIYDSASRKQLEEVAKEMGVDPDEGNKKDLSRRLAMAGYIPVPEEG